MNENTHLQNCTCGTSPREKEAGSSVVRPVPVKEVGDQTVVPAWSFVSAIQQVTGTFSDPAVEMEYSLVFSAWEMVVLAANG